MNCPGWVRLTQLAGIDMASRLHHLARDFSVNRHARKRLSFSGAGIVSESVKCRDVKSRDQTSRLDLQALVPQQNLHGIYK